MKCAQEENERSGDARAREIDAGGLAVAADVDPAGGG